MDWKLRKLRDGSTIPSAVGTQRKPEGALRDQTLGTVCEGVVIAVYYPDEETRSWGKGTQKCVTCDVRLTGVNGRPRYVPRAEVLQTQHGLFDEDIWIPRAAAQNITGGALAVQAKGTSGAGTQVTPGEDVDADHVLVTWLDNNPNRPVILPYCVPHPSTRRALTSTEGRVRRIRHHGVQVEWDKDGNWTLDATGAAKQTLGLKGTEASNSGTGGKITIKTKDGASAESSIYLDHLGGVKVTDGAGGYIEMVKSSKSIKIKTGGGDANLDGKRVLLGNPTTAPSQALVLGNAWKLATDAHMVSLAAVHLARQTTATLWSAMLAATLPLLIIPAIGNTLFALVAGAFWAQDAAAEATEAGALMAAANLRKETLTATLSTTSYTE